LFSVAVLVGSIYYSRYIPISDVLSSNKSVQKNDNSVPIVEMDAIYPANFANDAILVGASHNIFIGTVLNEIGTRDRGFGPETQFAVRIILNIKGDLSGVVNVNQEGGYENGALYIVEGNSDIGSEYLLKPGSTYLLATRYNSQNNWYTLNPFPTARELISNNSGLSSVQLRGLGKSDARAEQLRAIYPREVLLKADIENENARNSFNSIHSATSVN